MRILQLKFVKIGSNSNFLSMECEVVEKPFTWVIENSVMPCCQDVDVGPIDPDNIPIPLFENWKEFGVSPDDRSEIIPDSIDLNAHDAAIAELRLYGTIKLVESIERNDFQPKDIGLKAFLQTLLKCRYIRSGTSFELDLMSVAKAELKVWDKESIFNFVANVLGKKVNNISLADVAHVIQVLTGKEIKIDDKSFNLLGVAQELPTEVAAKNRPDEFFSAAFPGEIIEYDIVKTMLVDVDGDFYFGKGAKHPKYWGVNGPGNVLWRAEIQRATGDSKDVHVEWGPIVGTLYERAIESKAKLFGTGDTTIPFHTPLRGCTILDAGLYPISPRTFNTGIRYMTASQSLPVYKTCLTSTDMKTLEDEIQKFPIARLRNDPTEDEIRDELVRIYNNELHGIDQKIADRHFILCKTLGTLADVPEKVSECVGREAGSERIDTYVMPGKPQNVRGLIMYVWTLMHTMSDSLCYRESANDDFTVESAVEYCLEICLRKQKTHNVFMISCAYSEALGIKKTGMREVNNLDRGLRFDSL
jgi:hypothetical protein